MAATFFLYLTVEELKVHLRRGPATPILSCPRECPLRVVKVGFSLSRAADGRGGGRGEIQRKLARLLVLGAHANCPTASSTLTAAQKPRKLPFHGSRR